MDVDELPPIRVRVATGSDLAYVSQDGYVPREVVARKVELGEVFLAERDGPVGYLRLEHLWSIVPYIALIRVDEGMRRRGVGRALLAYVTDRLRDAGHAALYSSSTGNEPEPQAWHRHMGFEDAGALQGLNEGGVDEVFFRLPL